jgi:hypothetical protein
MFKKSNRKFNAKKVDTTSSDENEAEVFGKQIQKHETSIKKETITAYAKPLETKLNILEFADVEDDIQAEFKIKKSKESRRIVKELKKSQKEKKQIDKTAPVENIECVINSDESETEFEQKNSDSVINFNFKKIQESPSTLVKEDTLKVD